MLKFKFPYMIEEFENLDHRLRFIAYAMAGFLASLADKHDQPKHLIITSIIRQNSSMHKAGRSFDVRTKSLSSEEGDALLSFVNDCCIYGKNRSGGKPYLTAVDERYDHNMSPKATGQHIHVQVNSSRETKLIKAVPK